MRQMDLAIPCHCGARKGKMCKGGVVHVGRRIKWLLMTVRQRQEGRLVVC